MSPRPRVPGEADFRRRAPELSAVTVPEVLNVMTGGMSENLLTQGTVSNGDEAGAAMGVAGGTVLGPDRGFLGSFKNHIGTTPTQRLTSQGLPQTPPGISLTPAQVRPLMLD